MKGVLRFPFACCGRQVRNPAFFFFSPLSCLLQSLTPSSSSLPPPLLLLLSLIVHITSDSSFQLPSICSIISSSHRRRSCITPRLRTMACPWLQEHNINEHDAFLFLHFCIILAMARAMYRLYHFVPPTDDAEQATAATRLSPAKLSSEKSHKNPTGELARRPTQTDPCHPHLSSPICSSSLSSSPSSYTSSHIDQRD